ncbi:MULTISPECIES: hypothetical protein [Actinomadura]|uniref:Uncharacterized protein n=1 Tax=Actinomadura yumaensis TaxID=111807 RepID=A0ABW2CLF6_9ACTN|nr:hypothetical protein [Actinomadura sp. J1-007]
MIPYGLAYLSYRGAITTAQEFGKAVATIIDMNRFPLYSRLRPPCRTTPRKNAEPTPT